MEHDLQLLCEKVLRPFDAITQEFTHRGEERFLLVDDTAVRRDAHLAVGEGIECVYRLV